MNRRRLLRAAAAAALWPVTACGPRTADDGQVGAGPAPRPSDGEVPPAVPDASGSPTPGAPGAPVPEAPTPPAPPPPDVASVPLTVRCRDEVGLLPARAGGRPHTITHVVMHHTGVPLGDADAEVPARLRRHQRRHLEAGWIDLAYHLAVDRRGEVYELRDRHLVGDTATAYDPTGALLLVCEGDYTTDEPSEVQLERLAELVADAGRRHGVPPTAVTGHRDHVATACPGDRLQARLDQVRARAATLLADGPPTALRCADGRPLPGV